MTSCCCCDGGGMELTGREEWAEAGTDRLHIIPVIVAGWIDCV